MTFFFGSRFFPARKTFGSGRKTNTLKHRKTSSLPIPNNYYSRNKKTRNKRNRALPYSFIPQRAKIHITCLYLNTNNKTLEYFLKKLLFPDIF